MKRKAIIYTVLMLMAALPLFGVFAKDVSAATSRVAVIKEMKGIIKVKKAGGSKEFTAFAKMSLNEGDVLQSGAGSSVVLQFSNGSSEDDRMTVAANTTLTFSKLSNKKGTSTKVSMFNGSAWVDVKSIVVKDDEFTLETPSAVMGVRGTHLLVSVDPVSGATLLTVAAGVVATTSSDFGSSATRNVLPTQSALFAESEQGDSEITIAPVDLERLMSQSEANIVQAILESAAAIVAENEQYVAKYAKDGIPPELGASPQELDRFKSNTENLLGGIASQALKSGLLTQEKLDSIITEVKNQSGVVVDPTKNTFLLTEKEMQLKEEQRKKDDTAKNRAEERKKKEEEDRKANEVLLNKLEDERNAKEAANRKAEEEKRLKILKDYEAQLPASEKERFEAEKQKRVEEAVRASEEPAPSATTKPTPTPTRALSDTKAITSFDFASLSVTGTVYEMDKTIALTVPYGTDPTALVPTIAHTGVSISPDTGVAQNFGTPQTYTVTAENGTTQAYTVTVTVAPPPVNLALNPTQAAYPLVTASYTCGCDSVWSMVNGIYSYTDSPRDRWTSYYSGTATDWVAIDFGSEQTFNQVKLFVFDVGGGVKAPASYQIQYWNGSQWENVSNPDISPVPPQAALNTANFDTVTSAKLRIIITHQSGSASGLVELEVYDVRH